MKQDTLAGELESLMRARQACKTEAAADTMTHEIGLLVCGHPETILAALRDGEANSRAVPSDEVVERALTTFNGGLVREDDPNNSRGYTMRYKPREAMLAALSASKPDDASALLKEATEQVVALLREWRAEMPSTAQLIDSIATEWKASGHWSEWDQERREVLTKLALATDDLLARIDASIGRDGA